MLAAAMDVCMQWHCIIKRYSSMLILITMPIVNHAPVGQGQPGICAALCKELMPEAGSLKSGTGAFSWPLKLQRQAFELGRLHSCMDPGSG